ncbi:MAG: 50S ribosomal protein L3 [Endomicrobium sp.]|nr:50S ribosomal protein L3 [Endomicrobium sp.]
MLKFIIGEKIGMTQIFDVSGSVIPVTIVKAGPCIVTAMRTVEKDNYCAVQLAFGDIKEKKLNKSIIGFFKKNNLPFKKNIREFKIPFSEIKKFLIGQEIKVDIFNIGDYVDVCALSKGKGYAGVIKRHNFSMQPKTHGQSDKTRARGSSGGQGPQRVFKGMKMAGHLGNKYVTIQKLRVVKVFLEQNILLIKGAVPSVNTGLLLISSTIKNFKNFKVLK